MNELHVTAEPGVPQVLTERAFEAPRELVFRAFTEPDLLAQWLGPRAFTMRVDRFDLRDGGSWRYVHVDEAGNEYGFHGVFHGEATIDGMVQTFEFEGAPGHVQMDTVTFDRGRRRHDGAHELRVPVGRGPRRDGGLGHGRRHGPGIRTSRGAARQARGQPLTHDEGRSTTMQKITPFLWFDDKAEEAARFYVSLFEDAEITDVSRYPEGAPGEPGAVMTVSFRLAGQEFTALNGGPQFPFTEAVSLYVHCDGPGRGRPLLVTAHRGRRGEPVRVAEGPVRAELADRARPHGRAAR